MVNFKLIRLGIETGALLREIKAVSHALTLSCENGEQATAAIHVRSRPAQLGDRRRGYGYTALSQRLPKTRGFLHRVSVETGLSLAQATVLYRHPGYRSAAFQSAEPQPPKRYHLVLHSPRGSRIRSGNEEVRMRPGELWWFDHQQDCEEVNETGDMCIHLVFDLVQSGSGMSVQVERRSPVTADVRG